MDVARKAYITDNSTKNSVFQAVENANKDHDYTAKVTAILEELKTRKDIVNAKQAYEALIKVTAFEGTSNIMGKNKSNSKPAGGVFNRCFI